MTGEIRVLLVDDHPVVREGIRTILAGEPDMVIVGEASGGEEAVHLVEELKPQVVLMDIRMPGMGGLEATRQITRAYPSTSVIMLTMYESEMYVVEAIRRGAVGYLTKEASRELLCHTVRAVADGGILVRSGLLRRALQLSLHFPKEGSSGPESPVSAQLSKREQDVLRLLARGYENKAIGAELALAEVTVKKHVQSLIGKLGVTNRTQAAIAAIRLELVE